jgi:hypothetical protein
MTGRVSPLERKAEHYSGGAGDRKYGAELGLHEDEASPSAIRSRVSQMTFGEAVRGVLSDPQRQPVRYGGKWFQWGTSPQKSARASACARRALELYPAVARAFGYKSVARPAIQDAIALLNWLEKLAARAAAAGSSGLQRRVAPQPGIRSELRRVPQMNLGETVRGLLNGPMMQPVRYGGKWFAKRVALQKPAFAAACARRALELYPRVAQAMGIKPVASPKTIDAIELLKQLERNGYRTPI